MDANLSDTKSIARHVVPTATYVAVWAALLALTSLTVAASGIDMGSWNLTIAVIIATIKATLVALVFMHLAWSERFHGIVTAAAIVFLAAFIGLCAIDASSRGMADPVEGQRANVTKPF